MASERSLLRCVTRRTGRGSRALSEAAAGRIVAEHLCRSNEEDRHESRHEHLSSRPLEHAEELAFRTLHEGRPRPTLGAFSVHPSPAWLVDEPFEETSLGTLKSGKEA